MVIGFTWNSSAISFGLTVLFDAYVDWSIYGVNIIVESQGRTSE